jgi:hypothetical protein
MLMKFVGGVRYNIIWWNLSVAWGTTLYDQVCLWFEVHNIIWWSLSVAWGTQHYMMKLVCGLRYNIIWWSLSVAWGTTLYDEVCLWLEVQHYMMKFVCGLRYNIIWWSHHIMLYQVCNCRGERYWLCGIQYSQRHMINHCDRHIILLSGTDIFFALFNLFTYFLVHFGW